MAGQDGSFLLPTESRGRRNARRSVTRRLSSMSITRADLFFGPAVVAPPQFLEQPSNAHDTALAMEMAKHHLADDEEVTPPETGLITPTEGEQTTTDKFAFAFDIDSVLIRGGKVILKAIQAMKLLNGQNTYNIKTPYVFVTNGGGKTEEERCIQLSNQLHLEVSPGQFICGHTPMRELAAKYKTVLVVGGDGDKCRQVAQIYGFKDIITLGDVIKDNINTTPFRKLTEKEYNHSVKRNYREIEIKAIFVFADSKDWASD